MSLLHQHSMLIGRTSIQERWMKKKRWFTKLMSARASTVRFVWVSHRSEKSSKILQVIWLIYQRESQSQMFLCEKAPKSSKSRPLKHRWCQSRASRVCMKLKSRHLNVASSKLILARTLLQVRSAKSKQTLIFSIFCWKASMQRMTRFEFRASVRGSPTTRPVRKEVDMLVAATKMALRTRTNVASTHHALWTTTPLWRRTLTWTRFRRTTELRQTAHLWQWPKSRPWASISPASPRKPTSGIVPDPPRPPTRTSSWPCKAISRKLMRISRLLVNLSTKLVYSS